MLRSRVAWHRRGENRYKEAEGHRDDGSSVVAASGAGEERDRGLGVAGRAVVGERRGSLALGNDQGDKKLLFVLRRLEDHGKVRTCRFSRYCSTCCTG